MNRLNLLAIASEIRNSVLPEEPMVENKKQDLAAALARLEQGWQELASLLRQQAQPGERTVAAEKFVLLDAAGQPRATLGVNADASCSFILMDANGKFRAWLGVKESGAAFLSLKDEAGRIVFEAADRHHRPGRQGNSPQEPGGPDDSPPASAPEVPGPGLPEPGQAAADLSREMAAPAPGEQPGAGRPASGPAAALEPRLRRLERQQRRLKFFGGVLGALVLAVLAALGTLALRDQPQPVPVVQESLARGQVATQALLIKDEAGSTRAWLGVRGGVPSLELYDRGGKMRTALGLDPDGAPRLALLDGQQRPRLELALGPGEEAGLSLVDREGLLRAALGSIDPKYRVPPYLLERPVSSLVLFNKEGDPVWHAPLKFRR